MMKSLLLTVPLALLLGACDPNVPVSPGTMSCSPAGYTKTALLSLKDAEFKVEDKIKRQDLAMALVDCLSDPDPRVRDDVAYAALTAWMRSGQLDNNTVIALQKSLLAKIRAPEDKGGFGKPFAALVLSEVARVDRISPYMNPQQRSEFVDAAAAYMTGINDYRGFDDKQGWRHNVAHGADWVMQLTLNDRVTKADMITLRDAVARQVRADNRHAYIHGESARLARPILFMARRGVFTQAEQTAWLEELARPTPLASWNDAFKSEAGLAQRHNVKAFFHALYLQATLSQNDGTRQLIQGTEAALRKIP